ncbi:hypothetical protein GIB67_011014 [Kingdonia uniflora]|uniref:Uncharacterized protein n=1 Tax=Kingdonia uniflora TaxID=39325 RepID=A0A7J7L6H6_9MAGN|nr:hypothetical protein GIB67_011014 [Kingdonia uniflora]
MTRKEVELRYEGIHSETSVCAYLRRAATRLSAFGPSKFVEYSSHFLLLQKITQTYCNRLSSLHLYLHGESVKPPSLNISYFFLLSSTLP